MSYSRTINPRTSRSQRGRGGRAAANSYQPRPVNRGHPSIERPRERRHPETQYSDDDINEGQPTTGPDYSASQSATASTAESRSLQSRGTHYVLAPNPQKNAKLKRTAEEEALEFERHKDAKRRETAQLLSHQPPAAVGGYSLSKSELDRKREEQEKRQQMEERFAKVRQREKREEYRRQQREKEDMENQQMKRVQREKGKKLAAKREVEQLSQREEMRRKRLERFDTP